LPEQELWAGNAPGKEHVQAKISSNRGEKYLIAFFLLVLLTERWIAFKRNQ
jgi:hypothetical protein